jgi:hypothetical protein
MTGFLDMHDRLQARRLRPDQAARTLASLLERRSCIEPRAVA